MQKQSKKTAAKASSAPRLRAIFASVDTREAAPSAEEQQYAKYTCANCSSHFAMNQLATAGEAEGENAVSPMCPDCGSDDVAAFAGEEEVAPITDEDAVAVACSHCSTQLIFSNETKAGLNGSINCTVCGTATAFAEEEEDTPLNLNDDLDTDLDAEDVELTDDDDAFAGDDLGSDATGDDVAVEDDTLADVDPAADNLGTDTALDGEPADAVVAETDDLDVLDAIESEGDDTIEARFARMGDTVMAMMGTHVVGTLNKKDVLASRQEAFAAPQYLQALANSVATIGMASTLDNFGFQRNTLKVTASKIQALGEARVAERAQALAAVTHDNFATDYAACQGIAAVGLNKGFWPKESAANPLRTALASAFTGMGVKPAAVARALDQAFASASDDYHRVLASKTQELLAQPAEVRNSIATAIQGMAFASGFVAQASEDEDESDDLPFDEEATVSASVRQPVRSARPTAVASAHEHRPAAPTGGVHDLANRLRSENGGRLF